jgi:hypothetical protein
MSDMRTCRPEADLPPAGSFGRMVRAIATPCASVLAVTAVGCSVIGPTSVDQRRGGSERGPSGIASSSAPGGVTSTEGADTAGPGTEAADMDTSEQQHPYLGLWVTADNRVRQRLLPNGRYVEARGDNESAYTGRYRVTDDHIEYWDDSGFTADGEFRDDVLYHGGMVMHRATD